MATRVNLPSKNRLRLEDTAIDAITKVADGVPCAINVVIELMKSESEIDPLSSLGGMGTIFALDNLGIYGSHIWILYKDHCGQSVGRLVTLFRAHQLGFVPEADIVNASKARGTGSNFNFDKLITQVRNQIKVFWPKLEDENAHVRTNT